MFGIQADSTGKPPRLQLPCSRLTVRRKERILGSPAMAIPLEARLKWRRTAPFHVQLEVERPQSNKRVTGDTQIQGRIVRIFRTDGRLAVGDRFAFPLWVCRAGDEPTGPAYIYYDDFMEASYIEAYLCGNPPECSLAAYEFGVISAPSDKPTLTPRELEELLEQFDNPRTEARLTNANGGGSGDIRLCDRFALTPARAGRRRWRHDRSVGSRGTAPQSACCKQEGTAKDACGFF
jgi:hypothetical protein